MSLPVIAVTVGDPSGIGPEIAVKAARDPRVVATCRPRLYGPHTAADLAGFPVGRVSADSARAAYDAIVRAVEDAKQDRVSAMATAPVNKEAFAAAGLNWRGHTDLLAHLCGVDDVAMLFWSDRLRVVLATVHIPLAEVSRRAHDGASTGRHPSDGPFAAAFRRRQSPARGGRTQSPRR